MRSIGDAARGRDNNFNLLRVIAATAVMFSHSWPMVLGTGAPEPLERATGYTLGTCAVFVFFAVSGFFIAKSFDQRSSVPDFCVARIARLYPALLTVLVLTMVILGLGFSSLSPAEFFSRKDAWTYVPLNLTLRFSQEALPGIFTHNPYGNGINGSLWTLFYEVSCYAMVIVVGLLGMLKPRLFAVFLLVFLGAQIYLRFGNPGEVPNNFVRLSVPFVTGMTCYAWRTRVPLSIFMVAALAAVTIASRSGWFYYMAFPIALGYASLWAGLADCPPARRYNRVGDYSYGIYIYAFPVQQAVVAIVGPVSPWLLCLIAFPIILGFAILSWTIVESPALSRRHALGAAISAGVSRLGGPAMISRIKARSKRIVVQEGDGAGG